MMSPLEKELTDLVPFTPSEVTEILQHFSCTRINKGQRLLFPGRRSEDLGFVESGCLMLVDSLRGKGQIIELFSRNYFFLEIISFLKETSSEFRIEAVVDTVVYILPKKHLDALEETNPKWGHFMRKLTEKVCLYLAEEYREFKSNKNDLKYNRLMRERPSLFQEIPQYIIANYLSMTPEGLSKLRGRLVHQRIVD